MTENLCNANFFINHHTTVMWNAVVQPVTNKIIGSRVDGPLKNL